MHLSIRGIPMLRGTPDIIEALALAQDQLSEPSTEHRIEVAKKEAELAQREVDEGFPFLHAQGTVALWGALENVIRLFIARWLENFPNALEAEVVQRLRIRIGDYERLQGEDRFFYILDQLDRDLSAPPRSGVKRFEMLLEPFDLSGPIDDSLRKTLFEMSQVRNVLVHRGGRADRRLIEACPWLGFSVGDPVTITQDAYRRYMESVGAYVADLIARIGERFGNDMSRFKSIK